MQQRHLVPRPGLGLSLVVLGAALFVVNAGVSRVALRAGVDAAMLTTVRLTGTLVVLVAFAAVRDRGALRPPTGRLAALLVLHGLVGVAALQWTYFVAIDRLPVGLALLLEYQAPILVALWARVVQRAHVRPTVWLGLVLAVVGLAAATGLVGGGDALSVDTLGLLAGMAAAVSFATYFLVGEHGVATVAPLRVIIWSFAVATLALNLASPVTALPHRLLAEQVSLLGRLDGVQAPVWVLLLWVMLLGTLVPFAAELVALQHLPATTVTTVAMLEPVGAAALGWVWFGESMGAVAVLGCGLVVAGILLAQAARGTAVREPVLT